jgi:hypothetical protein
LYSVLHGSRRLIAALLLSSTLFALPSEAKAQAVPQEAPASQQDGGALDAEALEELARTLEDPEARQRVVEQLRSLARLQREGRLTAAAAEPKEQDRSGRPFL